MINYIKDLIYRLQEPKDCCDDCQFNDTCICCSGCLNLITSDILDD
jgi:hypothetical protein